MKKPEKPYMVIDGDDAFPDFGNPEWVEKMLAKAEKRAAIRPKSKTDEQQEEKKPLGASGDLQIYGCNSLRGTLERSKPAGGVHS